MRLRIAVGTNKSHCLAQNVSGYIASPAHRAGAVISFGDPGFIVISAASPAGGAGK